MYQPEAYAAAIALMIASMLYWGSWANTMKLTPGYAFQLFYWDDVIGIVLGSLGWLQREDEIQILAAARHKRAARLRRRYLKTEVELGDVVFPQKIIRRFQRRNHVQPQFLGQPPLQGTEVALAATTRLGRVGGNQLHPQIAQRAPRLA